jgi:glycosyltransferase involved in cell wall biosynthesis
VVGWINAEECQQLLSSSDVFILPSYHEGLPVAMLEAMAWGLPVIVSPVGGIGDVVKHHLTGLLVEPGNVQQLMAAMQSLIQDEHLRLKLGQQARQQVAPLDIRHYYSALLTVYRSAQTGRDYQLQEITVQSSNL